MDSVAPLRKGNENYNMNKKLWLLTDEQYDRLNPPPLNIVAGDDGKVYIELQQKEDRFMFMGYVPTPKNRVQWFLHHLMHGFMMGYPFIKCVLFAMDKENNSPILEEVSFHFETE